MELMKDVYDWPVARAILQEIAPRPRAIMGAMVIPIRGSKHP